MRIATSGHAFIRHVDLDWRLVFLRSELEIRGLAGNDPFFTPRLANEIRGKNLAGQGERLHLRTTEFANQNSVAFHHEYLGHLVRPFR